MRSAPAKSVNRKQQRQLEAQRRQRLKPLLDKVRNLEKRLATSKDDLTCIENKLADEKIYQEADRKDELTDLVKNQAALKTTIAALEWDWLEASEAIEEASRDQDVS